MADDILKEALDAFGQAQDAEGENRLAALSDIKFVKLLEQWDPQDVIDRDLDGKPSLTIDKLGPAIRQVMNDARQNKPAITVHPVDSGSDPETAKIMNGLIRHIEQSSDAEVAYDTALDFALHGGFGYFRINTVYAADDTFDQDIVIERVANPFSIYGDPYSTAADSSDWNTAFAVEPMSKTAFEKRWKGADAVNWNDDAYSGLDAPWMDGDQVLVAEFWRREEVRKKIVLLSTGAVVDLKEFESDRAAFSDATVVGQPRDALSHKVTQRIMTGAEVLETVDWAGRYIPIVPVYGNDVRIEGKRHLSGMVRASRDAQRNFNFWRSTSTELVGLGTKAPWIGKKGSFKSDAARWATANVENHAYLEYDGDMPPQRQPFPGIPAGALQEAMNAADDIKAVTGIHDASLGAKSNETSGRAIMARQREGDISTFHYIDNLSRGIRHAGRILIDLIPKVYAAPRVLRILGPDNKPQMVPVNQPVVEQVRRDDGQVQAIERIYSLTTGKYDLTVKPGPSFTTQREEAATQMLELIRAYPAAAPLIGDLLAENLDWPGADVIAERLKAMLPPQAQGQNPAMEEAKKAIAQVSQELQAARARVEALEQDRRHEARKNEIDMYRAETERMKVQRETNNDRIRAVMAGTGDFEAA